VLILSFTLGSIEIGGVCTCAAVFSASSRNNTFCSLIADPSNAVTHTTRKIAKQPIQDWHFAAERVRRVRRRGNFGEMFVWLLLLVFDIGIEQLVDGEEREERGVAKCRKIDV